MGSRWRRWWRGLCPAAAVLVAAAAVPAVASAAEPTALYLVTVSGPGVTGSRSPRTADAMRTDLLAGQDSLLASVEAPEPTYRWTDALDGFAVSLTADQAARLAADPRVALVEENAVRRLAATTTPAAGSTDLAASGKGPDGRGVVIGFVDSGLWPEGPVFAANRLGAWPRDFHGACDTGPEFPACNGKVVGARWFVDGFGSARVRSSSSFSPRDDSGHGTAVASIAAGDRGVSARASGESLGTFSGVAPRARIAVYKACWTAPDPDRDGCATADLVTAIDQATQDGVDVLNLSVGGPAQVDTVERALLGAAEAGVLVVGAAGNDGRSAYAAHASPWVTTVGASTGTVPAGRVSVAGGPTLVGSMASRRGLPRTGIVLAARAAASGVPQQSAAMCLPGSLDTAVVRGRIVVCERGLIGRVDKSASVALARGAGMVLADVSAGDLAVDVHAVPTVQLGRAASRELLDHLARHPRARAALVPDPVPLTPHRVVRTSSGGDPAGLAVKPDVVAPAVGQLAAVPPRTGGDGFALVAGTSAAAARVSGLAAQLLTGGRRTVEDVRSLLVTTATPLDATGLRQGGGQASAEAAQHGHLVLRVSPRAYRRLLDDRLRPTALNASSVLVSGRAPVVVRRVTNIGRRPMSFSSSTRGFRYHRVRVTPAAVHLAPGATAAFRIRVAPAGVRPTDDGSVLWRGADGTVARIPVVLTR